MDFTGIVFPYPVNRLLIDEERQSHLDQKVRLPVAPFYQLSVIKLNSVYMEQIDKYYSWRGALTGFMAVPVCMFSYYWFRLAILALKRVMTTAESPTADIFFLLAISIMMLPFIFFIIKLLIIKDSFKWTHYPIRLNRINRMVYLFRLNGTVLSVPWDDLYFTLGRVGGTGLVANQVICGHVLDKDRKTVLETFQFSMVSDKVEDLHQLWEFIRRYMEEGPEKLYQQVEFCMPVEKTRESYLFGLRRLLVNMNGLLVIQILMMPVFLLFSLGRFFAMWTSKIPQWPKEVEDACPIDPNDPYVKDYRTNP